MPHMANLPWTQLYLITMILFIIFLNMNYYNFISPSKFLKINKNTKKYLWKW